MAIIQNPVIGAASGTFGTAIFQEQYGKHVLRTKPLTYRDKNTTEQQQNRGKFRTAQLWVIKFLSIIRTGFASYRENMSAYAAALGWYISNAVTGTLDNYSISYSNAIFSFGDLLNVTSFDAPILNPGNHFTFDFENNSGIGNASASDSVNIILFNQTQNKFITLSDVRSRTYIDDDFSGMYLNLNDVCHIWMYCINDSGTTISNTTYVGQYSVIAP